MEKQFANRRDLETALIEKCWKDPQFREQVVSDPKGTLEQHLGKKLPPQVNIFIHQEDANTVHFSIPPAPADLAELSDADLERVAGGTDITVAIVATAIGLAGTFALSVTVKGSDQSW
jgi:hypothetical protein